MSIDHFFSRVWRIISIIGFGVSLLFIYRGLPDPTAVHFGETGRGDGFLPKEEIFYLTAGIMTLINMLALLLIKNIQKIPDNQFTILFSIFKKKGGTKIKETIGHWLHMLPALINTYMILVLRALLLLNDERTYNQDFSFYPFIGIIALLIWIAYLPVRLLTYSDYLEE